MNKYICQECIYYKDIDDDKMACFCKHYNAPIIKSHDEDCKWYIQKLNIDLRSELCKTCIHTKVCRKDKNLVGDIFVMGNPLCFDNNILWEEYKEREAQGFPCEDYIEML